MRPIDAHRVENLLQMCGSYHGVIAYDTVISILHDVPTVDVPDTDVVEQKDIGFERALAYVHGWSDCFSEHRWIPVTERLPKKSGRYIVTRGLNACDALWNRVYILNYSDLMGLKNEKIWWDGNVGKSDFTKYEDVTAWMPLPEPWKGETDDN